MNRLFSCILLLVVACSCTVYKDYPIEVFQPGVVKFKPEAPKVAIVYRNFKYEGDSLQHYYKYDHRLKPAKNDPKNLDSLLSTMCINNLATQLKKNNAVEEIRIFPNAFKPQKGKRLARMNADLVKKLTAASQSNFLLSLETFTYFYSEYSTTETLPTKSSEVITAAVWALYNAKTAKLVEHKTMIDTIFWNKYDDKGNYQREAKLPPRMTALKTAAQLAGENYAKRYYPSWQSVDRIYAVPSGSDFEAAEQLLKKEKWDEAIAIWKKYAADDYGRKAILARYNLAFAYEVKDQVPMARKWLVSARQLATKLGNKEALRIILKYESVLAKRTEQISELNKKANQ